jgi:hypothetical protein
MVYIAGGTVLAALAVPLILGLVPPNGLCGFRVSATLNDPDLWYAVNRYAARRLLPAGILIVLTAAGLAQIPGWSVDTYALSCLAVTAGALVTAIVQSVLYMKSLQH